MFIQLNTDKNINGSANLEAAYTQEIEKSLSRFRDWITSIEVHLSDENSGKQGVNDKRCLLEARLKGMDPVVVSHLADRLDFALDGAIDKMKSSLDTTIGRLRKH